MLNSNLINLSKRSYYIIFFKIVFLHFKFIAFFTFFTLPSKFLMEFQSNIFSYYCGLSLISTKIVHSVFINSFNLSLFLSKVGLAYSNYMVILFDFMFYLLERYNNVTFLSFFFGLNFVNFFEYSLVSLSKLFLSNSKFKFFFQPYIYILFLHRVKYFN